MFLSIKGGTQSQRKVASRLIRAIVAQPEFPANDVCICLKFHGIVVKESSLGLASFSGRVALIEIDTHLHGAALVDTIAHEMIHVYQFLAEDLAYSEDGSEFVWKGVDLTGIAYEDQPHEILAHGLSQYLLHTLEERAA